MIFEFNLIWKNLLMMTDISIESQAIDVYIQIGFTKIYDIDTITQRFQAEAIIETKWNDPNVTSESDLNKIAWKPELFIENSINDLKEEISYKFLSNEMRVSELRRVKGLFWENLELVVIF